MARGSTRPKLADQIMNHFLHGVARALAESFTLPDPILEIGSYQVQGQEHLINLRSLFPRRSYVGVDFRAGPGVDCVASVEALPQASGSVGTVIAFSVFEHVQRFWIGFEEVLRVLRPDGVLLVACPFYFHQHAFPSDYWRFTPQAFELLLAKYPARVLGWHGPPRRPQDVWAAAFRERSAAPTAAQFARYRDLLRQYAKEPMALGRRWRYRIGSMFFGLRPFAAHLQRDRWETVLQMDSVSRAA
jgi:SAM-dependent methyltransferase